MTPRLLLLSGPTASGKDTVTQALTNLDDRFVLFPRLKVGSGRSTGYRMVGQADLEKLHSEGGVIQSHVRYGNTYAVDAPTLRKMLTAGQWPVIHVGRLANLAPLRAAARSLSVLLWVDESIVAQRLHARGNIDIRERLAAWQEERDDVLAALPGTWDVVVSTANTSPNAVARRVRGAFDRPPTPVADVLPVLGAAALSLSRGDSQG